MHAFIAISKYTAITTQGQQAPPCCACLASMLTSCHRKQPPGTLDTPSCTNWQCSSSSRPSRVPLLRPLQPSIIYSGADDASFKGWDMRAPARSPAFVNRRAHGAGVCIVSGHPEQQHLLCTGSYDDHIRLWDSRLLQRPLMTHEVGWLSVPGSRAGSV